MSAGTYEKKVYGLAPGVNSVALFYNKDLLAAACVEPPRTWAELTAAAKKLTKGDRYGFAMSADNDGEGAWQFLPFLWSRGGDLDTLDSAPSVAALDLASGLVEQGLTPKSAVTWAQSDANDQFAARKAAMMINGPCSEWFSPAPSVVSPRGRALVGRAARPGGTGPPTGGSSLSWGKAFFCCRGILDERWKRSSFPACMAGNSLSALWCQGFH
ncbi:extracellular solute-binding protein [Streptomyces sp. DSM 41982]|uniref:Extracellular solute-binding protein n=1 Tax=Streptomyces evansiae TaxID=3075535 RepID=A0ABD5EAH8_9ACTN|nr:MULTISPECIES: extracellular solute-binding protein [unclassified Streptomyces]MDT0418399.1 extracellular solute-binding protein [Streptomyces sp. DSM 41982]